MEFPRGAAYKMTTNGMREVKVGSLSINGRNVDRVEYRSVLGSLFGSMMFNGSILPMDETCTDPEGCQCGTAGMKDKICGGFRNCGIKV